MRAFTKSQLEASHVSLSGLSCDTLRTCWISADIRLEAPVTPDFHKRSGFINVNNNNNINIQHAAEIWILIGQIKNTAGLCPISNTLYFMTVYSNRCNVHGKESPVSAFCKLLFSPSTSSCDVYILTFSFKCLAGQILATEEIAYGRKGKIH